MDAPERRNDRGRSAPRSSKKWRRHASERPALCDGITFALACSSGSALMRYQPPLAQIGGKMLRKIAYWGATGLVATMALLGAFNYLTTSPQAVENFRHMGYPQQLRVLLGIAKLAGAVVLLLPRLPTLKEWAYAGFTITWIAATVAHYLAADGIFLLPVALLGILGLSYVTRPANRRASANAILASPERGVRTGGRESGSSRRAESLYNPSGS